MISSIKFRSQLPIIFAVFVLFLISCKKDSKEPALATTTGANTLFVEVDGVRYQPKKLVSSTYSGNVSHNGIEFRIFDKSLRMIRQDFKLADMYSFSSESFLSNKVMSSIRFGLFAGAPGSTITLDKLLPVAKGDYDMGDYTDEGKYNASVTYKISNNGVDFSDVKTYEAKKGSGKLSITQLTDKIISGKIEVTVESGYGSSYDSKKITLYFDYTMNTVNNKVFE